ncbi:MAG: hypothetical protein IT330_00470 [Anaerolineae bacterium]|nr:hypothetical protein [Anaerolineae bacterium]
MYKHLTRVVVLTLLLAIMLGPPVPSAGQRPFNLADCADVGFTVEENFVTQGPTPADGNKVISDGDLLSPNGRICARNADLLAVFQQRTDLGLDAVDIINLQPELVAFSTELNDPGNRFTAGDLLTTSGAVIPNAALLAAFNAVGDLGLDDVHFAGTTGRVRDFLAFAQGKSRDFWLESPGLLATELKRYQIDLWFSTEADWKVAGAPGFLDGDLLSAATGTIVYRNSDLLAAPIPAGIPARGVDFGLDATAVRCEGVTNLPDFSTEIGYYDDPPDILPIRFTDGDVLAFGGSVRTINNDLIKAFEPRARNLGLDGLTYYNERLRCDQRPSFFLYLPLVWHNR